MVKNPPPVQETQDRSWIPGSGRSLEKEVAAHFSIVAWRILWMEKPGEPQSRGSHSQICLKLHSMHARAFSWGIIFCFGRKVLFCSASCYNGSRGSGEKLARLI